MDQNNERIQIRPQAEQRAGYGSVSTAGEEAHEQDFLTFVHVFVGRVGQTPHGACLSLAAAFAFSLLSFFPLYSQLSLRR